MDFHSLARKELQALCKKNKIPANVTNIAMAEALTALEHVEGLDELLDQSKSDLQQSPEKTMTVPDVSRTDCRTSTRRKPESSQPLTRTRGGTRGRVVEEVDQERSDVPKTPAAPSSRRRAPATSARQKEESSVQKVYGTRRSVRLLQKNMEKLSLKEDGKPGPLKIEELTREIFCGSGKSDGSSFENGECMQTSLEVCSEKFVDTEVSSELKDEDLKSKSELEPEVHLADSGVMMESSEEGSGESDIHLVEKSDKIMDVKDESEDGKGPDDNIMDLKADQIVGTEDSLSAKISDDVSATQTSVLQEENKFLSEEECVEPFPILSSSEMVSGEVKSLACAEDTAKHEGLTLRFSVGKSHVFNSEGCVMNESENDYNGQFDFEAESISEEESGDGSSEELSDDQSEVTEEVTEVELSDENLSEFQETDDEFEVQERDTTDGDSVSAMDKYNTKELVDMDVIEADITTGSHPLSDGRPGLMKQVPCDMVSGSEVEFSTSSATNRKNRCHAGNEMEEEDHRPLIDVYVSVEDFDSAMISHETPTCVKKMSPYQGNMTSGGIATIESAFPANQLSGQFPRPTLSAPRNSQIPKRDVVDDNENVGGGDEVKKYEGFEGLSIRELKKMLKHKLEIENNKNNIINDKKDAKLKVGGKTRTALQTLPENRMAINEAADDK